MNGTRGPAAKGGDGGYLFNVVEDATVSLLSKWRTWAGVQAHGAHSPTNWTAVAFAWLVVEI